MNVSNSDIPDFDMYPIQLNHESLGDLELDILPYFNWENEEEKFTANYFSHLQNSFTITIKTSCSSNIPIKIKILKPKSDDSYRVFASITNNFTTQVIYAQTDTILGPSNSTVLLKLPIKPRFIEDEGWLIEGMLYVQIYIFRLNKVIEQQKKPVSKRRRTRRNTDDDDFEGETSYKSVSNYHVISSRAHTQKSAREHRIEQFLLGETVTDSGEVAVGYCGIKNLGATCYMNSFLQALYHLPLFRKVFFSIDTTGDDKKSIIVCLQHLFGLMQMSSEPVDTEELVKSFGWNAADANTQHDVEEFSTVLLDAIKTKIKGTPQADEIKRLFTGEMLETMNFPEIGYHKDNIETFEDIQVVVNGCNDLNASLDKLIEPQLFTGYQTDKYGKQDGIRTSLISHVPDVLFLHLQRFELTKNRLTKINSKFQFPTNIDLDKYMTGKATSNETSEYTLTGVIVHSGDPIGGHYYSYLKTNNDDKWYLFNDSSVTIASEEKAVTNNFGGSDRTVLYGKAKLYSAYMLIYVRTSEIERIFEPISMESIPEYIKTYIKEDLERQKELSFSQTSVKFSVFGEEQLSRNVTNILAPMAELKEFSTVYVQNGSTLVELYEQVAVELKKQMGSFRLWLISKPRISSIIQYVKNVRIGTLHSQSIYLEDLESPELNSTPLMFFFVYYDGSQSNSFHYIGTVQANVDDTPLLLLERLLQKKDFTPKDGMFTFYGERVPNYKQKIDQTATIEKLSLINGTYIIFQSADDSVIEGIDKCFIDNKRETKEEEYIWYFDLFPELKPDTADALFNAYSETISLLISPQNQKEPIKCKVPAVLSFDELKTGIASLLGIRYDPKRDYSFIYRSNESIPINDEAPTIKSSFKKSPEENSISMVSIPKKKCKQREKCVRSIIDLSLDGVHVFERIVETFTPDDIVFDAIELVRDIYEIPRDRRLRSFSTKDNKIKCIYDMGIPITDTENPLRIEVIPKDQINCSSKSLMVQVLIISDNPLLFLFLVNSNEKFGDVKERIRTILGEDKKEFSKCSFKFKREGSYVAQGIADNEIPFDMMDKNDKILIVYPGFDPDTNKKRNQPVNVNLKINI